MVLFETGLVCFGHPHGSILGQVAVVTDLVSILQPKGKMRAK